MTTIRLPRRIAAFGIVAGILAGTAAGVLGTAVPAPAAELAAAPGGTNISWAVAPSTSAGPDGRTHFSYTGVQPNSVVHDYIGITNYSAQPVLFHVYGVDGITTTSGTIGLKPAAAQSTDIGGWISVEHGTVTVAPHTRLNEPVSLTVPANATPGDHVGGVVASVTEATQGGKVTRDDRVGVAMYLRVAGPLNPGFTIEGVSAGGYHDNWNPFAGGDTTVSYTVQNTGNVRLGANQRITVTGLFGITFGSMTPNALQQVLPGGRVRVTAHVTGIFPAGPMDLHIDVTPTTVPGAPPIGHMPTASYTTGMFAGPWAQLVLLIVLVALGIGIWRYLLWRRRGRAAELAAAVERGRQEAVAEKEKLTGVGGRESSDQSDPE